MKLKRIGGYTLIELLMVVSLLSIIASIAFPRMDRILQKAHQAKAKGNLGNIRSSISLYYAENEGNWPLANYPQGNTFYTVDSLSLSGILAPKYIPYVATPKLFDRMSGYNGMAVSYDIEAERMMNMVPPKDVFIIWGPAGYTPLLNSPFVYDNKTGLLYYANGNYDTTFGYFYDW